MPLYDNRCLSCQHVWESFSQIGEHPPCPTCQGASERIWLKTATVIPDSIPGGMVIENLSKEPKRYYSRSEIKRDADALGVENRVKHVGEPGSDKSKHTTRWI